MCYAVTKRVLDDASLRMADKLVMLTLAYYADADGGCWPSLETIADKASLDARQCRRVIKRLEDGGYLARARGTGRGHRSSYQLYPEIKEGGDTPLYKEGAVTPLSEKEGGDTPLIEERRVEVPPFSEPNGTIKGGGNYTPYKEIEPLLETEIISITPQVPDCCRCFDEVLRGTPGYEPESFRPTFWPKVESFAGKLDLESTAITIRDWVAKKRGKELATEGRIRTWLANEADPERRFKSAVTKQQSMQAPARRPALGGRTRHV